MKGKAKYRPVLLDPADADRDHLPQDDPSLQLDSLDYLVKLDEGEIRYCRINSPSHVRVRKHSRRRHSRTLPIELGAASSRAISPSKTLAAHAH